MAYVPVVGSIAEVIAKGTLASAGSNTKNVANVFHFRLAFLTAPATKTALQTAFNTAIMVPFLAAANARYTQSETTVRWIDDATDAPESFANAGVGAIATDSLPTDVCVSMLLRTAKRGRYYRGAKRFAGASEADTTGDILTGAGLARWQTLQTAVGANIVDALVNTWVPSVLSVSNSVLATNPTTVVANDVTACLLNKNVGTMRGRRVATVR